MQVDGVYKSLVRGASSLGPWGAGNRWATGNKQVVSWPTTQNRTFRGNRRATGRKRRSSTGHATGPTRRGRQRASEDAVASDAVPATVWRASIIMAEPLIPVETDALAPTFMVARYGLWCILASISADILWMSVRDARIPWFSALVLPTLMCRWILSMWEWSSRRRRIPRPFWSISSVLGV